jgi:hypothetical protein
MKKKFLRAVWGDDLQCLTCDFVRRGMPACELLLPPFTMRWILLLLKSGPRGGLKFT